MPLRAANARSFNRGGAARNRPYSPLLTKLGVDAGAAFSVRKLSAGYFGPCKNVRRSSDNAQADIWFVRGRLDQGAFGAFIGAGGSGFCAKEYDQSGNGRDASQSTAASQPQLLLSQIGGRPALEFSGGQSLLTASFASSTSAETFAIVAERTGSFTSTQWAIIGGRNQNALGWNSSTNTVALSGLTNLTATASDSAAHSLVGAINGSSTFLLVDGTSTTGTLSGSVLSGDLVIGATAGGGSFMTGLLSEAIMWPSGLSAAQGGTVHTNQSAYHGTP